MHGEWRCGGTEFQTTGTAKKEAPLAKLGCSDLWNKHHLVQPNRDQNGQRY